MFQLFAFLSYVILPAASLLVYRVELLQLYPDFIVSETITRSAVGVWLFYLFMFQLLLGSRPKWLEKGVGLDKILKVHASTSITTLVLLIWHKSIREGAGNLAEATGSIVAILILSSVVVAVCFWHPTPFSKIPIISHIKKLLDERVSYDQYKKYHNVLGIAAIIVGLHINLTNLAYDSFYAINMLRLYFVLCVSQYLWHKLIKPRKLQKELWELVSVETLVKGGGDVSGVVCLSLKYVGKDKAMRYQSGQFGFIKFVKSSPELLGEEHPFSFSSYDGDDLLQITVQDEGDFTHNLQQECRVGDMLYIDGPYGIMTLKNLTQKNSEVNICILAGGIGITPFLGWLKAASINPTLNLDVVWLQKHDNSSLVQRVLAYNTNENISVSCVSRSKGLNFSSSELMRAVSKYDISSCIFCICASKTLTHHLVTCAKKIGAKRNHIKTELFALA